MKRLDELTCPNCNSDNLDIVDERYIVWAEEVVYVIKCCVCEQLMEARAELIVTEVKKIGQPKKFKK